MNDEEIVLKRLKDTLDVLTGKNVITNLDFQIRNMVEDCIKVIEKQQAEIEQLKSDFEIVDHECSRLEQEDIKKDKIIDEMAKIIFTVIQGGELPLKILRKHLVRKICDKKFEECFMEDIECEECIKQYFERKIEQ